MDNSHQASIELTPTAQPQAEGTKANPEQEHKASSTQEGNNVVTSPFQEADIHKDGKAEAVTHPETELPSLKKIYTDYFSIGVAASLRSFSAERQELIKQQFNSITAENELKPESLLDYTACISNPDFDDNPQVNFSKVDPLLQFAQENGIPVRGHVLVWHSQTPEWLFKQGYAKDAAAPLVTKELMLKRMENYIKNVLEYTQANYPGLIYAWDVVNEGVEPADGQEGGYRSGSLWYQVIGPEYIERAFEYARKYADPAVKLFYNDYNTEESSKLNAIIPIVENLKDKKLIDGIGLQNHLQINYPSLAQVEASICKYAELGLELQITELDMNLTDNTAYALTSQASRYKQLFLSFKKLKDEGIANISNVTFWGLTDDVSWLNKPGAASYPLLFDKDLVPKAAFWGAALSKDIMPK